MADIIRHNEMFEYDFHTVSSEYNWSYTEHTHQNYCEIVTCRKGSFKHTINGKEIEQKEGDILFIREADRHKISGSNFVFNNVMFSLVWLRKIEQFLNRPHILDEINNSSAPVLVSLKGKFWDEYETSIDNLLDQPESEYRRVIFSDYLFRAFREFLKAPLLNKKYAPDIPEWLMNVLNWAHERRSMIITVDDLVERSHRCHEHVSRIFKKHLGLTPSMWLRREQIERAAELLTGTNFPVLQICYMVGFENPSYFHQCFKKHLNSTPAAYRKNYTFK